MFHVPRTGCRQYINTHRYNKVYTTRQLQLNRKTMRCTELRDLTCSLRIGCGQLQLNRKTLGCIELRDLTCSLNWLWTVATQQKDTRVYRTERLNTFLELFVTLACISERLNMFYELLRIRHNSPEIGHESGTHFTYLQDSSVTCLPVVNTMHCTYGHITSGSG